MANEGLKLPPEIEQLTQKLVADPKSRVFAQLADAYRKAGMVDEAIETAKKGLEHHPNYAAAHLILGRCYLEKQMYALAREEFEAAIKYDPQNLVAYKLLAGTYEKQNMFPEAVKFYQMVLDLEPGEPELSEKVATLKARMEEKPQTEPEPASQPEPVKTEAAPVIESQVVEPPTAGPEQSEAAAPEAATVATEQPVFNQPAAEAMPAVESPVALPEVLAEPLAELKLEKQEDVQAVVPETTSEVLQEKTEERKEEASTVAEEPTKLQETEVAPTAEAVKTETAETKEGAKPQETAFEPQTGAATATLAEIYAQQGFYEKAIDVYKELIAAEPEKEEYKIRMDELLEKAFPEEGPAPTIEEKAETVVSKPEEPKPEIPAETVPTALEPGEKPAPLPEPAANIFGDMFAQMEQAVKEQKPAETRAPETKAEESAPAELEKQSEPAAPVPEQEAVKMDFSALFSEPSQLDKPVEDGAKPAETGGQKPEGENTVSSFQAWLASLQK